MKRVLWLILVLLALPIDLSTAAPNSQKTESLDIPQALEPWVPWVYSRHPEWACAKEGEEYTCAWPGSLSYTLNKAGARFVDRITLLKEDSVPLPWSADFYPHTLQIKSAEGGSVEANIFVQDAGPFVKLPAGSYEISGAFTWDETPSELPAPNLYGIIEVIGEDGVVKRNLQRQDDAIWLTSSEESESLERSRMALL